MSLPEKKIKILHVVDLSKTGGVEIMFMQFLSMIITKSNIEHTVFALRITKDRLNSLKKLGIKVYSPPNNKYNFVYRINIIKLIATNNYDIVHGQNYSGNLWAAIGSYFQIKSTTLISHEHGGSWGARGIHRIASKFWAKNSKLVICNSKAAKKIIQDKIYDKAKLKLVYNGVNELDKETKVNFSKQGFNILFVGRLEEVKGIKELISALKILQDLNQDFNCNILGDGTLKDWIKVYLIKYNLSKRVFVHGVVNNVDQFMANSDVLILPSIREPLGNVIIEAANHNLPVIASNVDGIQEIVVNNSTGILITPKYLRPLPGLPDHVVNQFGELSKPMAIDSKDLAESIIKLKENPGMRKDYGLNANKLLKNYTIDRYVNQILQIYKGL